MLEERERQTLDERRSKARWVGRGLTAVAALAVLGFFVRPENRSAIRQAIQEAGEPAEAEGGEPSATPEGLSDALKLPDGVDAGDLRFGGQLMDFIGSGKVPGENSRPGSAGESAGPDAAE